MFTVVTSLFTLLATVAIYVRADPDPNNPGPGDVFIEAQSCTVGWNADPTSLWKTMQIDLMTGDNFNMVLLTTVATVDGTNPNKNTFSFTCPQVTPHSPIYFYQFSSPATSNKTWTGRFTIADSAEHIVAPSQSTQPDGEKIPWGTGALVNGQGSSPSSGAVGVTSSPGRTQVSPSTTTSIPSTVSGSSLSTSPATTSTPTVVYVTIDTVSATSSSTPIPSVQNSAVATLSVSAIVLQTGLALGIAAFWFAMMF